MARERILAMIAAVLALPFAANLQADESAVMRTLETLRGVEPVSGERKLARLNERLDDAWRTLDTERQISLPIIARELRAELARPKPDQFFVLDTAYFLVAGIDPEAELPGATDLALAALSAIDPSAPIIEVNDVGLLRLAHATARAAGPRSWPQLDRLFLGRDYSVEFFQEPHYVRLPAHPIRVLLYGATGPDVERHLAGLLASGTHHDLEPTLLAMLVDLGSESSADAVSAVMQRRGDYHSFSMAVTMLMEVGGPAGRAAVLEARAEHLDAESKQYLERIRAAVQEVDYELLKESVMAMDRESPMLADAELAERLRAYAQTGVDYELNPGNLLVSHLPTESLIAQLKAIRARALWRLNQHGLEDMRITNRIMNALQYRDRES